MTINEIRKGEYETMEYKQDIPLDKDKYLKTAVAFANGAGGRLIFGVQDKTWEVTGFSNEDIFEKMDTITNSIYDACEPKITPSVEIQEADGKQIIVVKINSGMTKPYFLKSAGIMDGTYIRIAGVTRQAEADTIQELQLEGRNCSFDQVKTADIADDKQIRSLCKRMYEHALSRCFSEAERAKVKKITKSQLCSWKLLYKENDKYYASNGFKLLTEDEEHFPDAFIQCASFKGNDRRFFLNRKEIHGPIDQQVEDATTFVMQQINMGSRIDGVYRKDFYELPLDSIREMIANAVCHRSYVRNGKIQVAVYDDRLEVTSPGRISSELSLEDMKVGNSKVRNVAIAAAFSYMHVIESWGTGIPRILRESKEYGLKEPELKNMGISFRITMFRKPFETDEFGVVNPKAKEDGTIQDGEKTIQGLQNTTQAMGKTTQGVQNATQAMEKTTQGEQSTIQVDLSGIEQKILDMIDQYPTISQTDISVQLGCDVNRIKYYIKKLQRKGILFREGSSQKGHWVVKSSK